MAGKPQDVHVHGKLSKKVAELTMVVHMLFKRNHEKEVEVQALKGVFEKEINRIQETCNQKIAWLEKQLDTQEDFRVNAEYKLQDLNQLKEKIVELEESNQRQLELINEKDDTARQLSFQVNLLKQKLKRSDERSNELLTPGANSDDGSGHRKSTSLQDDNAEKGLQSENKIKSLEEELADIKHNHLNELKVLTREKLELQRKLENYDSTLTSELDELKKTLDTLSQKQVEDINKLKAAEKTNKDLENKLKKAESDKKSLQSRLQLFQDQLKIALRNKTDGRGRHVVSQGARQRNFDEVNLLKSISVIATVLKASY